MRCNWSFWVAAILSVVIAIGAITLLLYKRLFTVAILESLILGLGSSWAYPSDNRSSLHLFWQRVVYFFLHFICAIAGWMALFILLSSYTTYRPSDTFFQNPVDTAFNFRQLANEPSFFIFLVAFSLFGITGQLAALVYYFSKKPSR